MRRVWRREGQRGLVCHAAARVGAAGLNDKFGRVGALLGNRASLVPYPLWQKAADLCHKRDVGTGAVHNGNDSRRPPRPRHVGDHNRPRD